MHEVFGICANVHWGDMSTGETCPLGRHIHWGHVSTGGQYQKKKGFPFKEIWKMKVKAKVKVKGLQLLLV